MNMSRGEPIYEGKAKILYRGPESGTLVQYFKDDVTAFNNEKHDVLDGKGILNNQISEFIFLRLAEMGIPTHFIRALNQREQLVREVSIVPLEVVVRNVAAGSLVKRLGLEEGDSLPRALVEYYYKDDALGDPLVSVDHITGLGWANTQELEDMTHMALRINDFLSGLFFAIGIRLVDFKLEFGRIWEDDLDAPYLVLADEISPDSCRLWDIKSNDKLDKDRFRQDLGGLIDAYKDVAQRLGVLHKQKTRIGEIERRFMKAVIRINLKPDVLDPQGKAIETALAQLGFAGVDNVRQGKLIELDIAQNNKAKAETQIKAMCEQLLANMVIENYEFELTD